MNLSHTTRSSTVAGSAFIAATLLACAIGCSRNDYVQSPQSEPARQQSSARATASVEQKLQHIEAHDVVASSLVSANPVVTSANHAHQPIVVKEQKNPAVWPVIDSMPDAEGHFKRVRYERREGTKYPFIRQEIVMRKDDKGQVEVSKNEMVGDHLIVTVKDGIAALEKTLPENYKIVHIVPRSSTVVVSIPADKPEDFEESKKFLSAHSAIKTANPDYVVQLSVTPNDPLLGSLWGMNNVGQTGGTSNADINAPEAWEFHTGSRTIKVGVIDSGVDMTHPDLAGNIWTNPNEIPGNGIDDDKNGYTDDVHGWNFFGNNANASDDHFHGTHVSGTIGAMGDNGIGVAGVCWKVSIVPLKFLNYEGSGYLSDAVEAVLYANSIHCDLTSNSWGGGGYDPALKDAIDAAGAQGSLFIAAAGNSSSNNDVLPSYPSSYPCSNIIAVAATDHNDQLAYFSSYGQTSVHIAAPGVDVYSTFPMLMTGAMYNYGLSPEYGSISGTSMATPHVSGAVALYKAAYPDATVAQIKSRIIASGDVLSQLSGKTVTSARLNVGSLIDPNWTPPPAKLELESTKVVEVSGNHDLYASPGDVISLQPTISNVGGMDSGNCILTAVAQSTGLTVLSPASVPLTKINSKSIGQSSPIQIKIASTVPVSSTIKVDFVVVNESGVSWTLQWSGALRIARPRVDIAAKFPMVHALADTTRNVVYVADYSKSAVMAINTDTGYMISRNVLNYQPPNEWHDISKMAFSANSKTLYVVINRFLYCISTPDLITQRVFKLPSAVSSIAVGSDEALYLAGYPYSKDGSPIAGDNITKVDPETGATLGIIHTNLQFPLIKTNALGTHLYVSDNWAFGTTEIKRYNISIAESPLSESYTVNAKYIADFSVDEFRNRLLISHIYSNSLTVVDMVSHENLPAWEFGRTGGAAIATGRNTVYVMSTNPDTTIIGFNIDTGVMTEELPLRLDGVATANDVDGLAITGNNVLLYEYAHINSNQTEYRVGLVGKSTLNISLLPTADGTVTPDHGSPGSTISCNGSASIKNPISNSILINKYWNFSDGTSVKANQTTQIIKSGYQSAALTVTDKKNFRDTKTFVVKGNTPPVIQPFSLTAMRYEYSYFSITASDAENDTLTYRITQFPQNGFMYMDSNGWGYYYGYYVGSDSFQYSVSDGTDTVIAEVPITITRYNNPPYAYDGNYVANTGETTLAQLQSYDYDGDPVAYRVVSGPMHGSVTINYNTAAYIPTVGFIGQDSFTYVANDGIADSNIATITFNVISNVPPIPESQNLTVASDGSYLNFTLNATDADGDILNYQISEYPQHGYLYSWWGNNQYSYNAYYGYSGTDTIKFTVSDGYHSAEGSINITVTKINHQPYVYDTYITAGSGNLSQSYVSAYDQDYYDQLTYRVVTPPSFGTVYFSGYYAFYTSVDGYVGSDSFQYVVNDGMVDSNIGTATVNVVGKPIANSASYTMNGGESLNIHLNAFDSSSSYLSYRIETPPSQGTLSIYYNYSNSPDIVYVPRIGGQGDDVFTFRASNGYASSDLATITIHINALNPWLNADIGNVPSSGSCEFKSLGSTFSLVGSGQFGESFTGAKDQGQYTWTTLGPDGSITAHLTERSFSTGYGKAGLVMRASIDDTAIMAGFVIDGNYGSSLITRTVTGNLPQSASHPLDGASHYIWMRLARTANGVTASTSIDGQHWTVYGSADVDLPATALVGLLVSGGTGSDLGSATFSGVTTDQGLQEAWTTLGASSQRTGTYSGSYITPFVKKWQATTTIGSMSQATVGNGNITVTGFDSGSNYWDVGIVAAYDLSTGSRKWQNKIGRQNLDPYGNTVNSVNPTTTVDGRTFFQTSNNGGDTWLFCMSNATGAPLWISPFGSQWESYKAPCVDQGSVFINGGTYGGLYGFNAVSGEQKFFNQLEQQDNWTPSIDDKVLYSCVGGHFRAHDRDTGALLWEVIAQGNNSWMTGVPVLSHMQDYAVVIDSAYGSGLLGVDLQNHSIVYSTGGYDVSSSSIPVIDGCYTYTIDNNGYYLQKRDLATGVIYENTYVGNECGQPIVTDDVIFVPTSSVTNIYRKSDMVLLQSLPDSGSLSLAGRNLVITDRTSQHAITVYISDMNAPTVQNISISGVEDQLLDITLTGNDQRSLPLTFEVVDGPTHGQLASSTLSTISYTPAGDFNGTDSFSYRAFNGTLYSAPAQVTIQVAPANDAPIVFGQSIALFSGTSYTFTPIVYDPDGYTALSYRVEQAPNHGQVAIGYYGQIVYSSESGYSGPDVFTIVANDGEADSNIGTISVTVRPPPKGKVTPDGYSNSFGDAVAMSGDWAAVGSPNLNKVDLYHRINGRWKHHSEIISYSHYFGTNIAMDGDTMAVVGRDTNFRVFADIFVRGSDDVWLKKQTVANDYLQSASLSTSEVGVEGYYQYYGSVAMANGTLALGDPAYGKVVIFQKNIATDEWNFSATLNNEVYPSYPYDYFGWSVAVDGDQISVGSFNKTVDNIGGAGSVMIYQKIDATNWSFVTSLNAGSNKAYDAWFGYAIAMQDDLMVIGAPQQPGFNGGWQDKTGMAYVYRKTNNIWTLESTLNNYKASPEWDQFGKAVAVSGNRIAVSAPYHYEDGIGETGIVETFTLMNGAWTANESLMVDDAAQYDWSTEALAMNGRDVLIGLPHKDNGIGAAYFLYVNSAPTSDGAQFIINEDTALINVTIPVSDKEGDVISIVLSQQAGHGSANIDSGLLTYTPQNNWNGTDSISFTVSDGHDSTLCSATITVVPVNDAPIAFPAEFTINNALQSSTVVLSGYDIDGDALTWRIVTPSPKLEASITGNQLWARNISGFNGVTTIQVVSNDGLVDSSPATITVILEGITPALEIAVNFQTADTKPMLAFPTYWLDRGLPYGLRTFPGEKAKTTSFGWNSNMTGQTRSRGKNTDQRLDTFCHFLSGSVWEMDIPNGRYMVEVSVGDATTASSHTINVEAISYWKAQYLAANIFANKTLEVEVKDGRLTIDQGSAGYQKTRINYVIVRSANTPPKAVASVTNTSGKYPLPVTFDGSESSDMEGPIQAYVWEFGDGETASGAIVTHTYTVAGTYSPKLVVTDNGGKTDRVTTSNVTVLEWLAPIAQLTSSTNSGSAPLKVEFSGSGSVDTDGTIVTYNWAFGDGKFSNGINIIHEYTIPGTYIASLYVVDDDGLSSNIAYATITIAAPVIAVNFQQSSTAAVPKFPTYWVDAGQIYGPKIFPGDSGKTMKFGWNVDHGGMTRNRNVNATDERLDTLCHFKAGGIWEVEVRNGDYDVEVGIGDPSAASTYTLNIEGINFWTTYSLNPKSTLVYASMIKRITVSDGKISVDQGKAENMKTRINYIIISPAVTPKNIN